ncbi:MAG TPA: GGDEF domain-containing protein, partial [Xanthobacteraceae bacterium]|nr:GGDEF domain-containing protein [Xanthobacteraceae bacterium]
MAFAQIALGQIRALRQPASPRIYEIWYNYATGYNPSLNEKINDTLAANGTLSADDIDFIYATFISPTRVADELDQVNDKISEEIDQVMALIDAAARSASKHDASLQDVSTKLGKA